jgi:hypothetical protein
MMLLLLLFVQSILFSAIRGLDIGANYNQGEKATVIDESLEAMKAY